MKKLFAVCVFVFGYQAQAGLHLEPYLGYNVGALQVKVAGQDIGDAMSGVLLGARVGYSLPLFYVAADYSLGSGLKSEVSASSVDIDVSRLGVVAGFTGLPMFDFYGGYLLNTTVKVDQTGVPDFKGSGLKVGVGFTMLPLISINAEYIMNNYDDDGAMKDIKETAAVVSVSLPLDL